MPASTAGCRHLVAEGEYLLEPGFKDPAAVLAGGVLEEHLRKLCERHAIGVTQNGRPKPSSRMNEELASRPAHGKLAAKNVTAWLELRNSAAHGNYNAYSADNVKLMILGVREFAARTLSLYG